MVVFVMGKYCYAAMQATGADFEHNIYIAFVILDAIWQ